jgi:RNA polymerase sigma-70 factor (ECF subfamily)
VEALGLPLWPIPVRVFFFLHLTKKATGGKLFFSIEVFICDRREMEKQSTGEITDQSLMLAVRDGNLEKLGILFERYHHRLFNFLFRLTGNRHLSEDLVQEVFVRILKYRHTYRGENQFTTWLFQVARNARIDHVRQSPREDADVECRDFAGPSPTPAENAEKQEQMHILLDALSKLPEERREILLLRGFQGLKFEEIAQVLDCPVNTVKWRAFQAIRELKASVDKLRGWEGV